jgi:hypothetical protein
MPGVVLPLTRGKKWFRFTPSKAAGCQTTLLEELAGSTRTQIVSAQLLFEQLVAVNHPHAPFDLPFRRESMPPFAHGFERTPVLRGHGIAWHTSNGRDRL